MKHLLGLFWKPLLFGIIAMAAWYIFHSLNFKVKFNEWLVLWSLFIPWILITIIAYSKCISKWINTAAAAKEKNKEKFDALQDMRLSQDLKQFLVISSALLIICFLLLAGPFENLDDGLVLEFLTAFAVSWNYNMMMRLDGHCYPYEINVPKEWLKKTEK